MKIDDFKDLYNLEAVILTQHFLERIGKRDILLSDVKSTIMSGELIEIYEDDYPHPSALILGYTNNKIIHVVAGIGGGYIWLITSYIPDLKKWDENYKTRKVDKK